MFYRDWPARLPKSRKIFNGPPRRDAPVHPFRRESATTELVYAPFWYLSKVNVVGGFIRVHGEIGGIFFYDVIHYLYVVS